MNFDNKQLASLSEQLVRHPLYHQLRSLDAIKTFMEVHVFAVWDFMTLVKFLQRELTCVQTPWVPVGSPSTRRLINEIVWGEESDIDAHGNPISHFELYLQAMTAVGANTQPIENFVYQIKNGTPWREALDLSNAPDSAVDFVTTTMECVEEGKVHVVAGVFTFGREDLIPDVFIELVRSLSLQPETGAATLLYYLERHIEVDGDTHGPMALQMIEELCDNDPVKQEEAIVAACEALQARIDLWDGIAKLLPELTVS